MNLVLDNEITNCMWSIQSAAKLVCYLARLNYNRQTMYQ